MTVPMNFCPSCGSRLEQGDRFCPACGAEVQTVSHDPTGVASAPPETSVAKIAPVVGDDGPEPPWRAPAVEPATLRPPDDSHPPAGTQTRAPGETAMPRSAPRLRMPKIRIRAAPDSDRILSVDALRGMAIVALVFLYDAEWVYQMPVFDWLMSAPVEAGIIAFPDLIFPAFLLVVGISIPLAIKTRVGRGASSFQLWRHILTRTLGLLVLDVFMTNLNGYVTPFLQARLGVTIGIPWAMLMWLYGSAILIWTDYPAAIGRRKSVYACLRIAGLVSLAALAYRIGQDAMMMRLGRWGVLSQIGWAYLTSCVLYLGFRKRKLAMIGCVALLVALHFGVQSYSYTLTVIANLGVIVLAGVIVALLMSDDHPAHPTFRPIAWMSLFAISLLLAGFLFRSLYHIPFLPADPAWHPAWSLYCAGACILFYAFVHWVVDVMRVTGWARFFRPAGLNPLLAGMLPAIVYFLLSLVLPAQEPGVAAIVRSCVFTLAILGMTYLLTKCGIRLRL